jgi:hypothetical protein
MAAADGANAQAFNANMDAMTEEAQLHQRQTAMKRELAKVLGETDVAYAASGIDISAGAAETARATAEQRFVDESTIDRGQTSGRIGLLNERARMLRRMGQRQLALGVGGALLGGLGGLKVA